MWHDDEIIEGGGCIPNCEGSCEGCDPRREYRDDSIVVCVVCGDPATTVSDDQDVCQECYDDIQEDKTTPVPVHLTELRCGCTLPTADLLANGHKCPKPEIPISWYCVDCRKTFPTVQAGETHNCERNAS